MTPNLCFAVSASLFSALPVVIGAIEPMVFEDVASRLVYVAISAVCACIVLTCSKPKNKNEAMGRIAAGMVAGFVAVEPIAARFEPWMGKQPVPLTTSLAAAFCAATFLGICAWWVFAFVTWIVKSPQRIFRVIDWWRGKGTIQSIFEEDSGDTSVTSTKGVSQGQPAISDTRIPAQYPVNTEHSNGSISSEAKAKTIG